MLEKKRITDSDIEQVKKINLITYLEMLGYRPEYKYGDRAMFLSSLRSENHPSFWVSRYNESWRWKDWGTEEQGDIIKFVELYHGVGFPAMHTDAFSESDADRFSLLLCNSNSRF
ncbi:MAG: hypothetical protein AB1390_12690 [Nitrospirota bacterium]